MPETVKLFLGPDDTKNVAAHRLLEQVPGIEVREITNRQSLEGRVALPFIAVGENGWRHFGLEAIESFVKHRLATD